MNGMMETGVILTVLCGALLIGELPTAWRKWRHKREVQRYFDRLGVCPSAEQCSRRKWWAR